MWFSRHLICVGEIILKGPKRKNAKDIAGAAAANLKYIPTKAEPAFTQLSSSAAPTFKREWG